MSRMRSFRQAGIAASVLLAIAIPILLVVAQTYPTHRGNNQRIGMHDADPKLSNPGRSFLRWWDPLKGMRQTIDNWQLGASQSPDGSWLEPSAGQAGNAITEPGQPVDAPDYVYTPAVPSAPGNNTQPLPGYGLNTFSWSWPQFLTDTSFALYVNIPVGPTDNDPGPGIQEVFPQRYFVYLIDGVVNPDNPGQPIVQIVDTYASGGGQVRLGNNGFPTDRVFQDDNSGPISITLLNTIPRDNQGNLTDTRQNVVVYADSATLTRGFGGNGAYVASPVVGELTVNPGAQFPWRVVSARNEPFSLQVGSRALDYNLGIIRSFRHNGFFIDVGDDGTGRRNQVFSWPAKVPFVDNETEANRYTQEKRNFILGQGPSSVPPSRAYHNIYVDNESVGVTYNPITWTVNPVGPNNKGVDFFTQPVTLSPFSVERVVFEPNLGFPKNGTEDYELYVWIPGDASLPQRLRVEVYEGGTIDPNPNVAQPNRYRIDVDQSAGTGWVRLTTPIRNTFRHRTNAPLYVAITNFSTNVDDAGKLAYADMVRFVKVSDLSVTSTPVMTRARVRANGGSLAERDVIIAAYENGRIYCIDAEGNPDGTTDVYWVYPSEMPSGQNDPNWVAGEDGPDGIAENPIGFDLSSALVQRVETSPGVFEDLLYVGSRNGRVYCIEMAGRGDGVTGSRYGTTRRRWSYPDDWPAATRVISNLGPIVGSVTYNRNSANQQTIYVPTVQGRLFALDAVGNLANKTTTVNWSYPLQTDPVIGPIRMTPAVRFGRVYFGTGSGAPDGNNRFYAVNEITHVPDWTFTGTVGNPTIEFNESSPAVVPAADANYVASPGGPPPNVMPNTVFVANMNQRVYAINADTGGMVWETPELNSTAVASLTFTYMRVFNRNGLMLNAPGAPVVVVPTLDGRWVSLFAHVDDLNLRGNTDGFSRTAWEYQAEGERVVASVAVGGQLPADNFCWLYGADSLGYLYAWNDDPGIITPGDPPGQVVTPPNADESAELDTIVNSGKIALLVPSDYENLTVRLRTNQLSYTDITNAITARPVRRVFYDYGETLYAVIYDIPSPAGLPAPLNAYSLEMQFNTPGSPSTRRATNVQTIPNVQAGQPNGVAFVQHALLGAGGNALAPGRLTMTARALIQQRNTSRAFPNTAFNPSHELRLANPMGLITRRNRVGSTIFTDFIGNTFDAEDPEVVNNGNLVGLVNPTNKPVLESLGPDPDYPADKVSHGQTASAKLFVVDRSLMTLLYGPDRGLQQVRLSVNDLAFNVTDEFDNYGVIKPLDPNGAAPPNLYPNMEELPVFFPNISLDYPDVRREAMRVTREVFGAVDNPMFNGVGLEPPRYTNADRTAYRGIAYNNQLTRTLTNTEFNIELDVAKYQPPSRNGYTGRQIVYVDANQPGRQFAGGVPQESYRTFDLFSDIAVDERLRVGTPTIDLGSMPAGAGFLPLAPWDPGTIFSPWNGLFDNFFARFSVFNEGNVNMLNVRLAQTLFDPDLNRQATIKLGSPSLHELAWLDAPLYLNSDLDPQFAPAPLGGRVILQKARPGGTASRLSVNPIRLPNPNLGVVAGSTGGPDFIPGPLLNPAQFEPGDPKVGATAPIGTPVGSYSQQMYVFEDRTNSTIPGLGPDPDYDPVTPGNQFDPTVYMPWAEPGFVLRFNIRETRLTNLATPKAASMVDNLGLSGNEPFFWSSMQPAALRDGNGNVVLAFSSTRQGQGGPDWASRIRNEADTQNQDVWRLYVATLNGGQPPAYQAGVVESAIRDLNVFTPSDATPFTGRWFRQEVGPFPTVAPAALFNPGPNATIEPGSMAFGSPAFPANGVFDPLDPITTSGRSASATTYLAFVGEAVKRTSRGDRIPQSRLMITTVNLGAAGNITVSPNVSSMPFDPDVRKSRPAMITVGENAQVFYTTSAAGLGQINWTTYRPGSNPASNGWSPPQTLNLGNGFESVGQPALALRRYSGATAGSLQPGRAVIDLTFTAKLRGRAQAEAFFGRILADNTGRPTGQNPILSFGAAAFPRQDGLLFDAATGTYWSPGVEWLLGGNNNNAIDLLQLTANGVTSIVVGGSRKVDEAARTVSFDTIFGGKVYLDAANGSIKFSGALIPRNAVLGIRYVPRFLRVSTGLGNNYRSASVTFDERFLGEFGYWATPGPNPNTDSPIGPTALARNDRFLFTFARTSGDGSSATRPFMRTYRFGVQLPTGVQTDNNGNLTRFKVTVAGAPNPLYYQVDPAQGKVFFMAEAENRVASIRYDGVDEAGRPLGQINVDLLVDLIPETVESAVPIEQVANESALTVAIDPMNGPFNAQGFRRPGLFWLFWTSTRAGAPDLYFETIAPRFTPLPPQR